LRVLATLANVLLLTALVRAGSGASGPAPGALTAGGLLLLATDGCGAHLWLTPLGLAGGRIVIDKAQLVTAIGLTAAAAALAAALTGAGRAAQAGKVLLAAVLSLGLWSGGVAALTMDPAPAFVLEELGELTIVLGAALRLDALLAGQAAPERERQRALRLDGPDVAHHG
jgi:hypothetical protein